MAAETGQDQRSGVPTSEKDFQAMIVQAARLHGWKTFHHLYSVGSDRGWPDLACFHPERGALYLEVKVRAAVRPEQVDWLETIRAAGDRAYVVRPEPKAGELSLDDVLALLAGETQTGEG